jgi:hypothetical protein
VLISNIIIQSANNTDIHQIVICYIAIKSVKYITFMVGPPSLNLHVKNVLH